MVDDLDSRRPKHKHKVLCSCGCGTVIQYDSYTKKFDVLVFFCDVSFSLHEQSVFFIYSMNLKLLPVKFFSM